MTEQIKGIAETREVYIGNQRLDPAPSLKVHNHSPDGWNWGYGGSGPSQLALGILLFLTDDIEFATANYQDFKWEVIAGIQQGQDFTLDVGDVQMWIYKKKELEFERGS
jgi:hypothetical protein